MQWEMTRPFWAAALLVLLLLVYYWRHSLVQLAEWQRAVSLAIRVLLAVVLVVAICGVRVTDRSGQLFVIFAVDRSGSISEASQRAAETFLDEALQHVDDHRAKFLRFAAEPGTVAERGVLRPEPDRHGTDLAATIAVAAAAVPSAYVPRIVLLSDGNQTVGDALQTAQAGRVPVWTVPLPGRPSREVYVSAVETPGEVRPGEPFDVDVVVRSTHTDDGSVQLRFGPQVANQQVHLVEGNSHVRFPQLGAEPPRTEFIATITGFEDTLKQNNRASGVVFMRAMPRVLLVSDRIAERHPLATPLKTDNLEVVVQSPQRMPGQSAGLEDYDLLILDNVSASSLPAGRMTAVQQYVGDFGGGLIVAGGDRSFIPGGYRDTTLEKLLPVWCRARTHKVLAIVFVIDRSYSMGEKEKVDLPDEKRKIELAKQAARSAIERLKPQDKVGVIAFHERTWWVSQIRPCTEKDYVLEQIDKITAEGKTNVYSAVEEAYLALRDTPADRKHMFVLSDGRPSPDIEPAGDFGTLTKKIAASGITVSTLAVGEEADRELLKEIARAGKGESYYCRDPGDMPQILQDDARKFAKEGIAEGSFAAKAVDGDPLLAGLDVAGLPRVSGYLETIPKDDATLVLATDNGDPLLCWRQDGRGLCIAFTSDVIGPWADRWPRWSDFDRFWSRLVRRALRKDASRDFVIWVQCRDGRGHVILDAVDPDGKFLNGAEAGLAVTDPEQKSHQTAFTQVAPGRYVAEFAAPKPGMYSLETTFLHGGRSMHVPRRGLVAGYPDELRVQPTNAKLLRAIAKATGGRYDPQPADVFAPSEARVARTTPWWPYLLTAAVLLFVIDVALKRIDLTRKGK